jgi:hypothetical protein
MLSSFLRSKHAVAVNSATALGRSRWRSRQAAYEPLKLQVVSTWKTPVPESGPL